MVLSNGNVFDCEAEGALPTSSSKGPGAVERPSYYGMKRVCYTNDME